ncbi:MAG: hypothetical protein WD200_02795 [Candidatus Andersenbacteria bacterium]
MMSKYPLRDELVPALNVLRQLGGSITFVGDDGEEYVIARKADMAAEQETQLTLPSASAVSAAIRRNVDNIEEDVLERINQDIALSVGHGEEDFGHMSEEMDEAGDEMFDGPTPPPIRVRFEPLRGDLSPDLQE